MILYCLSTRLGCGFGVVFTLVSAAMLIWRNVTENMQVEAGVRQFFFMRYLSVAIASFVVQLISYPVGYFAKALPIMKVRVLGRECCIVLNLESRCKPYYRRLRNFWVLVLHVRFYRSPLLVLASRVHSHEARYLCFYLLGSSKYVSIHFLWTSHCTSMSNQTTRWSMTWHDDRTGLGYLPTTFD